MSAKFYDYLTERGERPNHQTAAPGLESSLPRKMITTYVQGADGHRVALAYVNSFLRQGQQHAVTSLGSS